MKSYKKIIIQFIIICFNILAVSINLQAASIYKVSDLLDYIQQDGQVFDLSKSSSYIQGGKGFDQKGSGGGGGGTIKGIELDPQALINPLNPLLNQNIKMISKSDSKTLDMILFDDEMNFVYSLSNCNKEIDDKNKVILNITNIDHKDSCEDKSQKQAFVAVNIQDLTDYNKFSNFKLVLPENLSKQDYCDPGEIEFLTNFNEYFNGYRYEEIDKRTLYPNKNEVKTIQELKNIIPNLNEDVKPILENTGETQTLTKINRTILPELQFNYICPNCGGTGEVTIKNEDLIKTSQSGNLITNHIFGNINNGYNVPSNENNVSKIEAWDKKYGENNSKTNKIVFNTPKLIDFYPYIKMRYITVDNDEFRPVYITSTNKSSIISPIAVNILSESIDKPTINIDSQWVSDNNALKVIKDNKIEDMDSIIKGGSTVNLNTYNEKIDINVPKNNFLIESYITCVPNKIKDNFLSYNYTEATAISELTKFKNSIKNNLNEYYIEKFVAPGIYQSEYEFNNKAVCVDGINAVNNFQNVNLNKTNKYYFNTKDILNNNKINVNIENELIDVFTIKVDTDGRFNFYKNNKQVNYLDKNQVLTIKNSVQTLATLGQDWVNIEKNTCAISNLIDGLDRNLGLSGRYDGKVGWYNEAIDGISIVRQRLDVNLYLPKKIFNIQDPALCGKAASGYDKYPNKDLENTWRTIQYKLSKNKSTSNKQDNIIGTLAGVNITYPGIEDILKSKLFYISNTTVEN